MPSSERVDAIVVGAGPAGLATSRELGRRGIRHVVVDRGDAVGWSWRHAYDSLTLHTGKHMSALPGLGFGRHAPLFLPRDAFVAYLERYARHFALPVVTGCGVHDVRQTDGGWVLATDRGEMQATRVVLATGIMSNPNRPRLPGEERFAGRVLHSVDYKRPDPFVGRRVLVVGVGNSAGEIASELGAAGIEVTLAVRSGVNVMPRSLFGVPIQYWSHLANRLPRPVRARVVGLVRHITEIRRGPPVLPRSSVGPLDAIPLIGFHLVDAIRDGRVRLRGAPAELTERAVRFEDGTETPVDDVLLATGFRAAVGPVRDLVGLDARGFVRRRDRVIAEDTSGLYVVGHNYDATGGLFNIRRDAPLAARLVAEAVG